MSRPRFEPSTSQIGVYYAGLFWVTVCTRWKGYGSVGLQKGSKAIPVAGRGGL
jgi:hypothetical protein